MQVGIALISAIYAISYDLIVKGGERNRDPTALRYLEILGLMRDIQAENDDERFCRLPPEDDWLMDTAKLEHYVRSVGRIPPQADKIFMNVSLQSDGVAVERALKLAGAGSQPPD